MYECSACGEPSDNGISVCKCGVGVKPARGRALRMLLQLQQEDEEAERVEEFYGGPKQYDGLPCS